MCGTNSVETSEYFILRCPNYAIMRLNLIENIRNFNTLILLYGSESYDQAINQYIVFCVIDIIIQKNNLMAI